MKPPVMASQFAVSLSAYMPGVSVTWHHGGGTGARMNLHMG
ncbi:hypothetical protein [Aurantiacibacter marinus]|nr:hypothetical protein [Aurantiacibacter marinus]